MIVLTSVKNIFMCVGILFVSFVEITNVENHLIVFFNKC